MTLLIPTTAKRSELANAIINRRRYADASTNSAGINRGPFSPTCAFAEYCALRRDLSTLPI